MVESTKSVSSTKAGGGGAGLDPHQDKKAQASGVRKKLSLNITLYSYTVVTCVHSNNIHVDRPLFPRLFFFIFYVSFIAKTQHVCSHNGDGRRGPAGQPQY